jgi:hypothetical protein
MLTFSGDPRQARGYSKDSDPVAMYLGMTQADFSDKGLGITGAIIVGAWITHKDNGALSVLSLKDNRLPTKEGGEALAQALASNSTPKELDVSSNIWKDGYGNLQGDGPGFAQELAVGVKDNGALSVLSLKDNRLATKEGGKALAQALANNSALKELDVSSNVWKELGRDKGDGPGFAQELAVGIKDNGALSLLNLTDNDIGEERVQKMKEMCVSRNISLLIN